jgi:hypothetical protein
MKKYLAIIISVLVCAVCFSSLLLLAQDEKKQEEEKSEYSHGEVSSVSGAQIIVGEYDDSLDRVVDVAYTVDPKAEFENITSLKDIAVGDSVEIEFIVRDGIRVVKFISKEKFFPEDIFLEEQSPLQIDAGHPQLETETQSQQQPSQEMPPEQTEVRTQKKPL